MEWAPCDIFELLIMPNPKPHKPSPAQWVSCPKMKGHVQIRSCSGVVVRRCARVMQWDGRLDLGKRGSPSALLSTPLVLRTSSLGIV